MKARYCTQCNTRPSTMVALLPRLEVTGEASNREVSAQQLQSVVLQRKRKWLG